MFRKTAVLICSAAIATAALGACAPIVRYQGYTSNDKDPASAVVGQDTQQTVRTKFGTPTAVSTFDPYVWYYMAQITDQFGAYNPEVRSRQIVQITFDKTTGVVKDIQNYDESNGRQIAYSNRETPTIGRQLGILEQLLSNLGNNNLPPEEYDPGNLPGQGR